MAMTDFFSDVFNIQQTIKLKLTLIHALCVWVCVCALYMREYAMHIA